jgi:hypothetical protein
MISSPFKRYLLVLKTVVVTLAPVVFSPALFSAHSKVLRFEYSFGIRGEKVGQGVFNLSIENPWHDVGQRTHGF